VFLDGTRYLMALYDGRTKMKIFKHIMVNDLSTCANNEYESAMVGKFVDITQYTYTDTN